MTPIEKNISVVDEQGNEYEATYPRRAKGLVKNGRARFVSENRICLACPPDTSMEDEKMTDTVKTAETAAIPEYSIPYVLGQIEKIQQQTEYLNDALKKLSDMADGDSGDPGCPGNIQGQAKAEAFGDIVRCRETTNQQMLKLYEKMYDNLSVDIRAREELPTEWKVKADSVTDWLRTLDQDDFTAEAWQILMEVARAKMTEMV